MTPDTMLRELATELQSVIRTIDEAHLRENPEEEFENLAARLLIKLNRKALTLVPVVPPAVARRAEIERTRGESAARIFDIFTEWLIDHPERSFRTAFTRNGKFEVLTQEAGRVRTFVRGETVHDAYAQAAQTISFNGGSLDGEKRTEA